jgi:regulatory protein
MKDFELIKNRAIYYVSKRDYGSKELFIKLEQKFPDADLEAIEKSINKMFELGFLSDERFVEVYIRQEKRNNNGPLKIRMKLKQKYITDDLINIFLNEEDQDFYDNCANALILKSKGVVNDYKEKQKYYRFLASRGYLSNHINYAFEKFNS